MRLFCYIRIKGRSSNWFTFYSDDLSAILQTNKESDGIEDLPESVLTSAPQTSPFSTDCKDASSQDPPILNPFAGSKEKGDNSSLPTDVEVMQTDDTSSISLENLLGIPDDAPLRVERSVDGMVK